MINKLLISFEFLTAIRITLIVLMSLSAIFIIFVILMQLGNSDGLGAISGQDSTENYFGKNKSRSFDARLKRGTVYAGIFLLVCSILFFILKIPAVAKWLVPTL